MNVRLQNEFDTRVCGSHFISYRESMLVLSFGYEDRYSTFKRSHSFHVIRQEIMLTVKCFSVCMANLTHENDLPQYPY